MEPNPNTPDPTSRPSSVVRPAAPESGPGSSARTSKPPDPADETPTIISLNRSRAASAEAIDNLHGMQLGHFELAESIGVGGMAAVVRANDLQLGRVVALKILPPEMAADPENISRFKQEARAAARLDHENIARVYFCGEDQGLHFIAFEYVEGIDLRTMMARGGPLAPGPAVKYMLQVAAGLAHAASRGVVHRDIKPSNIIITPEGRAKIVDMGLARHTDVHGGVTQSGVTLGTFDYISPEQAIEPRAADVRSDIYSLGCTFYHLLTGQPPVPEGTAAKKLHHHQHVAPVDPRELNPAVPDELVAVLGRMMAKDPRDRYQRPEDLIQHLLAVAQKLELPADGSSPETVLFVDAPLPQRRRVWPVLEVVAAAVAVVILAAILGTGGGDPRPPWSLVPAGANPALPVGTAPAVTRADPPAGQRVPEAADVQELVALLKGQNARRIVLTGREYDLSSLAPGGPDGDRAARPLAVTHAVRLEGVRGNDGQLPVLRCSSESGPGRGGNVSPALVNILAAQAAFDVELVNMRFVIPAAEFEAPACAISATGSGRVKVTNCEFVPDAATERAAVGAGVRVEGGSDGPLALELEGCWFAAGACAVDASDRVRVSAKQCAFGPHDVVFRFGEKTAPRADPDRPLAELEHCTVLMHEGTIFQAERDVSGTIRAADCLFARGGERGEVIVVRAAAPPARESRPPLAFVIPDGARAVFSGVSFWATPGRQSIPLDECRQRGFVRDAGADALVVVERPWKSKQPLDLLPGKPLEAFVLLAEKPELRSRGNPRSAVGVHKAAFGALYPRELPALAAAPPEPPANELVVDPKAQPGDSRRMFPDFTTALAAARGGELTTVLVRHTGALEVEPQVLARPNLQLVVRPAEGCRPILTLAEKADALNPAMFAVNNGSLSFKDLQFRLHHAATGPGNWVSVVNVTGNGKVEFEGCAASLGAGDEAQPATAALVTLTTDPEAAADGGPEIRLANCFVRGRGHVLAVRGSRALSAKADNVLTVLRGSFLYAAGQPKDPPLASVTQLTCQRVTAYLTEPFLDLRGGEGDKKVIGLARAQVRCDSCLLVAAGDKSLVSAAGVDRDTLVKPGSGLLAWEGQRNLYGNYQKFLDVKAGGAMAMMMATEWASRDWQRFTNEPDESFAGVSFGQPPDNGGFLKAQPDDFQRATLSDTKRMDMSVAPGASTRMLPRADDE